jgi:hypothetical protein
LSAALLFGLHNPPHQQNPAVAVLPRIAGAVWMVEEPIAVNDVVFVVEGGRLIGHSAPGQGNSSATAAGQCQKSNNFRFWKIIASIPNSECGQSGFLLGEFFINDRRCGDEGRC